jgi:dethiobiotin synthetase
MSKLKYFVSGIGTEVGKTYVSAILCKLLNADYWKPIQAGGLDFKDSDFVKKISGAKIHPETYLLKEPMSPHAAAQLENISIDINNITLPHTNNHLIVEGAGGLMVPLNYKGDLMIDLIAKLNLPVILVSRYYLGSINHTILSLEMLFKRNIPLAYLIFNGKKTQSTFNIITQLYPKINILEIEENGNNFKTPFPNI